MGNRASSIKITRIELAAASRRFERVLSSTDRTDFVVVKRGRPQFYIVSPGRYRLLRDVTPPTPRSILQRLEDTFDALVKQSRRSRGGKAASTGDQPLLEIFRTSRRTGRIASSRGKAGKGRS